MKVLTKWSRQVHLTMRQKEKFYKAMTMERDFETLDIKNKSGTIRSSDGKETYIVTSESCTCKSYQIDKMPCKHMYLLSYRLKTYVLDISDLLSGEYE